MEPSKDVSLSWLIITTRDYKAEYDWFWDKLHFVCYGVPKCEKLGSIPETISKHYESLNSEEYYAECVLMPELQMYDIEEAEKYIINWCNENKINYVEDLEQYKKVEAEYWGYGDVYENLTNV